MPRKRTNPFLDAKLTPERVALMALSAVVFISQAAYGAIVGTLKCGFQKPTERKLAAFHTTIHKFMNLDVRLHPWLQCRVDNTGGETFERGAIAVCNHQSLLDTLCLLILSPRMVIVTGKRVWNNPVVRLIFRFAEFVNADSELGQMTEKCRRLVGEGYTVVFFPEGKRSRDCNVMRFHSGAFHVAKEIGADLLPLYLHGSGHVLPLGEGFQNRAELYVEIGKRIVPDNDFRRLDPRKQANAMHRHYEKHYEEICSKTETSDYFSHLVANLFGKVSRRRRAERLLARYNNFAEWIDKPIDHGERVAIDDRADGVFTLLFALVHPSVAVSATGAESLRRLYNKCKHLPENISWGKPGEDSNAGKPTTVARIDNIATVETYKTYIPTNQQ